MDPLTLLTLATTAYGGYQGYRQAKQAGASGIGRLLGGATGAYTGYTLGKTGGQMFNVPGQLPSIFSKPQISTTYPMQGADPGTLQGLVGNEGKTRAASSLVDILTKKKELINTIQLNLQVY